MDSSDDSKLHSYSNVIMQSFVHTHKNERVINIRRWRVLEMWWPRVNKKNCPFIEIHYSRKEKRVLQSEGNWSAPFFQTRTPSSRARFFHETVIINQKSACISKKIFWQYYTFKCFQNSSIIVTWRGNMWSVWTFLRWQKRILFKNEGAFRRRREWRVGSN